MKRNLIVVTRSYPYGLHETFLETELPIISEYFEKIYIFPATISSKIRDVPGNVIICNTIGIQYKKKLKWFIKTIFSKIFIKSIVRYLFKINSLSGIISLLKYSISYNIYRNFACKIKLINSTDIVYSYWFSSVVQALVDYKTKHNLKYKIVTRVHGGDLYEELTSLGFFPFRNNFISKIDKVISISKRGKNYLEEKYNVNNVECFRLGVVDKGIISKSSDKGFFTIVSVSNIIPIKRVDLIAKSVIEFSRIKPEIQISWYHFGSGKSDKKFQKSFSLEKFENIEFHFPGRISNKEIFKFYQENSIDVFINLSLSEGIPVSIMEAISFGIPIIATDVGGTSEIVNDNSGILLSANPHVFDVVKALKHMESEPFNRELIKKWSINYSAHKNYEEFAKALISL